ncbi:50S ribosomal protein L25 [Cohnella sp.]|uniref:50S ribosomal protein L25 n=1 Tax=Cohnella sp. TaxID=1883426 RepID=UPI003569531C
MSTTLQVQHRDISTRSELRRIRTEGKVPGVIYGKGLDVPANISVDNKELMNMLRTHPHAVVEVEIPGAGRHPVMMTDLQRDTISHQVTHIDFLRINMNEKITTLARLEVTGTSPGEKEGGMLQMVLHEVEIQCYPKDIPDSISVDVSDLAMGENLTINDLKVPSGIEITQDPSMVIIAVLAPQKAIAEDEVEAMDDKAEENAKHEDAAQAVEKD